MSGDRERCLATGVDDYITKPVQAKDFLAALERWAPKGERDEAKNQNAPEVEAEEVAADAKISGSLEVSKALSGASAGSSSVLDGEVMAKLRALAEATDIGLLPEIIDAFLSDSTARIETLRQAEAQGDTQVLRQAAHALKGASANIGANPMAAQSQHLQAMGDEGSVEGAALLIEQLEAEFALVRADLEAELERLSV